MNYPVWQLDVFGGGLWVILIAVFHVYIAHFAVAAASSWCLPSARGCVKTTRQSSTMCAATPASSYS